MKVNLPEEIGFFSVAHDGQRVEARDLPSGIQEVDDDLGMALIVNVPGAEPAEAGIPEISPASGFAVGPEPEPDPIDVMTESLADAPAEGGE